MSETAGTTSTTNASAPQRTTITRIATIGAGFMGGGIAAEMALRVPSLESVTIWDPVDGAAERAIERAAGVSKALVDAGLVSQNDASTRLTRLHAAPTMEAALDGASYVAEAVPEDLAIKQRVFHEMDALASPEAILASNTSGYDPAGLAAGLRHPERVVVAHYFGPAYLIPAVEVVPHAGTAPWAVDATLTLLRAAGKRPIPLGKFVPGFVANRLQQALFREALHLMRQGVATPEALDEIVRFSFGPRLAALGPMTVADFAGLDVYASLARNVWPDLSTEPASESLPPEIDQSLAAGRAGVKTGAGFYDWPDPRRQDVTARRDRALIAALQQLPPD